MKKLLTAGSAGAMLLALTARASAYGYGPKWTEMGDAGSLPLGAQSPVGIGPLNYINGGLGMSALLGGIDFEDMFLIFITDPKNFRVTTDENDPVIPDAFANFDTALWLFKPTMDPLQALGFLGNNDHPDVPGSMFSLLIPVPTDGSPALEDPGLYYIAITRANNNPDSDGGEIFDLVLPTEISGPDGPGGMMMLPITGWTGDKGAFKGEYSFGLQGVSYPPAPGTIGLLALAALRARRRRQPVNATAR